MRLDSPHFTRGESLPKRFTAAGENLSPSLTFHEPPAGAGSFALLCEDPDAPGKTWTHWILFNLPASAAALPEGLARRQYPLPGVSQGLNDFGGLGYAGPLPPPGQKHRYIFRLYAVSGVLKLAPGIEKTALLRALDGKTLGQAELTVHYP